MREQRAGGGASVVRVCASIIACNLAIGSRRPATASGVAILGACSRSGHVADAQVGEIPGFARQPPPTGVAEMSASGHRLRRRRRWRCVVRVCASIIACGLAIGSGWPATTSGVAILGACSRSGHVADAQVGEIPGFAQQPPPTGVAEMSASGHRLRHRRR